MARENRDFILFEIALSKGPNGYVERVHSKFGEFTLPFTPVERGILSAFEDTRLLAQLRVRKASTEEAVQANVQGIGDRLFRSLFGEQARAHFLACDSEARYQGSFVRLRIQFEDTPELENHPWEYIYDERQRHLALSERTPVVRYLPSANPPIPVAIAGPVRMVVVISMPQGTGPLEAEREWYLVERSLSTANIKAKIKLVRLDSPTLADLSIALQRTRSHILHYIGHADVDTATGKCLLLMPDSGGIVTGISTEQLAAVVGHSPSLRLVFLNACKGAVNPPTDASIGLAQSLVSAGVPAVVAMNNDISDSAAGILAQAFYTSVAAADPVDVAAAKARQALYAHWPDGLEWGTPVLYMRAPDGVLFKKERREPLPWWLGISAGLLLLIVLFSLPDVRDWLFDLVYRSPVPPSRLEAIQPDLRSAAFSWADNSDVEDGYVVELVQPLIADTHREATFDTLPANVTSYTAVHLDPDTRYTFRVAAWRKGRSNRPEEFRDLVIQTQPVPPIRDLRLRQVTLNSVDLTWQPPRLPVDSFRLILKDQLTGSLIASTLLGTTMSYRFSDLTASTIYVLDIRSLVADRFSSPAATLSFTTPAQESSSHAAVPQTSHQAQLELSIKPIDNSSLTIDGHETAVTGDTTSLYLDPGDHEVTIMNPNYPIAGSVIRLTVDRFLSYDLEQLCAKRDSVSLILGLGKDSPSRLLAVRLNGADREAYDVGRLPKQEILVRRGRWSVDIRFLGNGTLDRAADSFAVMLPDGSNRVAFRSASSIVDLDAPQWRGYRRLSVLVW